MSPQRLSSHHAADSDRGSPDAVVFIILNDMQVEKASNQNCPVGKGEKKRRRGPEKKCNIRKSDRAETALQ
ncbi:hypothetical protein DOE73_29145 [Paenibacillus dendritiformis]|nr:hypothetical protein DOE73_29145 [Paenibacillus dendritiformis]